MKKCLLLQELHSQSFPEEDEFCNNIIERSHTASGGLLLTMSGENVLEILKLSAPVLQAGIDYKVTSYEKCLPPIKHIVLDSRMTIMLQNLYVQLYPNMQFNCPINQFAKKALRASVGEVLFGSLATSRENNIVISAYWPTSGTNLQAGQTTRALPQAIGQIQYYIKHELISVSDGNKLVHIFAYVNWYKKHQYSDWFGSTAIVCVPEFEFESIFSFIPIQRISSVCVHGNLKMCFTNNVPETVHIVCPVHCNHCY